MTVNQQLEKLVLDARTIILGFMDMKTMTKTGHPIPFREHMCDDNTCPITLARVFLRTTLPKFEPEAGPQVVQRVDPLAVAANAQQPVTNPSPVLGEQGDTMPNNEPSAPAPQASSNPRQRRKRSSI